MNTPLMNGYGLEDLVELIYKKLGYVVKRNVIVVGRRKGRIVRSQIDLVYYDLENTTMGIPRKVVVEVKYRKQPYKIKLSEIAKFRAVLELLNHNPKYSEFITNSEFSDRAIAYARMEGIKLIDGKKLYQLYKIAQTKNTLIGKVYEVKGRIDDSINGLVEFLEVFGLVRHKRRYHRSNNHGGANERIGYILDSLVSYDRNQK